MRKTDRLYYWCAGPIFTALLVLGAPSYLAAAGPADAVPELVIFLGSSPHAPAVEDVIARVNERRPLPGLLGLGNPVAARFVLPYRAAGQTKELLWANPDSPRAQLERSFVMTYPLVVDLHALTNALLADPDVSLAGINDVLPPSISPNDTLFAVSASPQQYQWGPYMLNLPQAWDRIKGNAYLGAVDDGIKADHEDLQAFSSTGSYTGGNFRPQLSWDFIYGDSNADELQNGQGPLPDAPSAAGHGTHVSGILAATPNNFRGVAGTCWNCSLLMAKRYTNAQTVAAFTWLVDHGVEVINASLGAPSGQANPCNPPPGFLRSILCPTLDFAEERGVLVVAASGNAKGDINFPASDPRVVAVGGIRSDGIFWDEGSSCAGENCGSNYTKTAGTKMQDLVAPAKDILSTVYTGRDWITTSPICGDGPVMDGYGLCTGTSMASPFVAGIAGLLRSANPLLGRADTRNILVGNASRSGTGWDSKYGYGVPNASAAVASAMGHLRRASNRQSTDSAFQSL